MPDAALTLVFGWMYLICAALTAAKLVVSGLHRKYRIFFVYFLFLIPYTLASLTLDKKSTAYYCLFVFASPALWVFHILIVLELYHLILEHYPGLYTLGRWAMYLGMAISLLLSALALLPRITSRAPQHRTGGALSWSHYVMAGERGVDLALVILLLLMLYFLGRYPVSLSRNVVLHATVFTVFFLSTTFAMLLYAVFGFQVRGSIDAGLTGVSCACMIAWLLFLTAKGEEVRHHLPWIAPEHEERLLQQLDSLNATLLKVSRN